MRRIHTPLLLAVALVGVTATYWLSDRSTPPSPAPAVQFRIIDGAQVALDELRGHPVLVNFWATSCTHCLAEMPQLAALYRRFRERGFELIGVAMPYDQPAQVLRLVADRAPPYPIALDPLGEVAGAFGDVRLTPTSFLISPAGEIVARVTGTLDLPAIASQIDSMLPRSQRQEATAQHLVRGGL